MLNYSNKYKDAPVNETIDRILKILDKNGIEIEQNWYNDNAINTFSVRINIKGSNIGSNGKGISKEFALASGLAELLERLQNQAYDIPKLVSQKFTFSPDEILLDSEEVFKKPDLVTQTLIDNLGIKDYSQFNKILQDKNKLTCIPFYDIRNCKKVYLPYHFIKSIYATNGMCAGNTMEEALIQGLSEIFERYAQKCLLKSNINFSEINLESIKLNKILYNQLKVLKQKFNIKLLDCTIDSCFPTVCLLISNKEDGLIGFKLGCHPNIFIALERTLTEATQGQSIKEFSKKNSLEFNNNLVLNKSNLCNLYDIGYGSLPISILDTVKKKTDIINKKCLNDLNNYNILKETLRKLLNSNYDILIRDNSILGFPSFQIIIPNFSEMETFDYEEIKFQNSLFLLEDVLKIPSHINSTNIDKIITGILKTLNYISFNKTSLIYTRLDNYKYPFYDDGLDLIYFLLICFIYKKDHLNAIKMTNILLRKDNIDDKKRHYLKCLQFAIKNLIQFKNLDYFKKHASFLFNDKTIDYILKLLDSKNAITFSFTDEISSSNFSKLESLSKILYSNLQLFSQNGFIKKIDLILK